MQTEIDWGRLRAALETLAEDANELTGGTLNFGGCGLFAVLVADRLERAGLAVGIAMSGNGGDIDMARAAIPEDERGIMDNWRDNGIHNTHCAVTFRTPTGEVFYETEAGIAPVSRFLDGYPVAVGRLTVDELRALVDDLDAWNFMFCRDCYADDLEALVESALDFLPDVTQLQMNLPLAA